MEIGRVMRFEGDTVECFLLQCSTENIFFKCCHIAVLPCLRPIKISLGYHSSASKKVNQEATYNKQEPICCCTDCCVEWMIEKRVASNRSDSNGVICGWDNANGSTNSTHSDRVGTKEGHGHGHVAHRKVT